jgi:hypothetical protein
MGPIGQPHPQMRRVGKPSWGGGGGGRPPPLPPSRNPSGLGPLGGGGLGGGVHLQLPIRVGVELDSSPPSYFGGGSFWEEESYSNSQSELG